MASDVLYDNSPNVSGYWTQLLCCLQLRRDGHADAVAQDARELRAVDALHCVTERVEVAAELYALDLAALKLLHGDHTDTIALGVLHFLSLL